MESTEDLKSCRAKLLTPPLATLHPSPTMGGECHAERGSTPALPREGVPCGLIAYDFEACVLSAAAPLLLGGVGGRLPQRSSSPPIVGEG